MELGGVYTRAPEPGGGYTCAPDPGGEYTDAHDPGGGYTHSQDHGGGNTLAPDQDLALEKSGGLAFVLEEPEELFLRNKVDGYMITIYDLLKSSLPVDNKRNEKFKIPNQISLIRNDNLTIQEVKLNKN